ncbi:MAG: T9SS type A sorting domain-containing protein, partial [Bacteroidales bacterium]|nr:T9SS type A sorting domain-containing protein [Bacteroidales bacterium]
LSEENKPIFTLYDTESYANYRLTTVLYPKWGNLFGLVFNYEDNGNYWVLEIAARDKDAWIKQVKNGDFVGTYKWMPRGDDLATYAKEYADTVMNAFWIENDVDEVKNYWTLDLVCNEYDETTITINGHTIFDAINAGSGGKVGIWQNWCPVFAKSFEVRQLGEGSGTSVFEKVSSNALKLYPNPVTGREFTIITGNDYANGQFKVYDITGKLVYSRANLNPVSTTISLDEFNAKKGLYILHLKEGNSTYTGKLIVQ